MDLLSQIGVPAAVVILLLREVFRFLKERNGKNGKNGKGSAGDKPVEFWQQQNQISMTAAISSTIVPILTMQTETLNELRLNQQRVIELLLTKAGRGK